MNAGFAGIRAAILLMRASRQVGHGEHCHRRGDAAGARTSFRRAIDLVDAAGTHGPVGLSVQMAAIQGVVESTAESGASEAPRPGLEPGTWCLTGASRHSVGCQVHEVAAVHGSGRPSLAA
jgi:hypothetical protein